MTDSRGLLRFAPPPVERPRRRDRQQYDRAPVSVPAARAHVRSVLLSWDYAELEESGALLVSELATNAVLHASSSGSSDGASVIVVELLDGAEGVVLVVEDASPTMPVARRPGRESSTGRGIWLLAHFSSDRGAERLATGKRVWAVLCPEGREPDAGSDSRLARLLEDTDPA